MHSKKDFVGFRLKGLTENLQDKAGKEIDPSSRSIIDKGQRYERSHQITVSALSPNLENS